MHQLNEEIKNSIKTGMKKFNLLVVIMLLLSACSGESDRSYYILDETDLVPEGIAYSEAGERFYLTSLGKSKIISFNVW